MNIHELLFGRWQDKPIDKVIDFKSPGLYYLNAKTFGLKGFLGGSHSWIAHIAEDFTPTVIEVTDIETLEHQGATNIITFKNEVRDELQVLMSNRDPGQLWFGHEPLVVYLGCISKDAVHDWTKSYPLVNNRFSVLFANCNTFTSWILHLLDIEFWTGIGYKSKKKWARHK